ncbi:MAG: DUF6488 family protein [Pseudomonadota bacterium]|nr:DUF6488 family protein [Pseudomonadota bacterium]
MRLAFLALAALTIVGTPVVAHPDGHDNQFRVERRPIAELAQDSVVKLVTQAKLPASWSKAPSIGSQMRTKNGAEQWVITFENKAIRVRAKRRLYVLMTPEGEFISANHKLS